MLTAAITVLLGLVVLGLGQIAQKFFIEPIQEQKRVIGEIAYAVIYYGNVGDMSPPEIRVEAQQKLRDLSARLNATLWAVPRYRFFESRGWVEKRENVNAAKTGLVGWSNSVLMKDSPHGRTHRSAVIKALDIPES